LSHAPPPEKGVEEDHEAVFKSLTSTEQKLAFYARIYDRISKRFRVSLHDLEVWRKLLPVAIETEYLRIDAGNLPRTLTFARVRELAEEGAGDGAGSST